MHGAAQETALHGASQVTHANGAMPVVACIMPHNLTAQDIRGLHSGGSKPTVGGFTPTPPQQVDGCTCRASHAHAPRIT